VISNTTNVAPKQADVRPQAQVAAAPPAPPAPPPAPPAPPAKTPAFISIKECGKPDYPKNAARNEEEGTVEIKFLIDGEGKVKNSEITRSSGSRELDKAAVAHLTSCNKFRAGTENGKAVESSTTVAYQWKLE
jgi:protein TonB